MKKNLIYFVGLVVSTASLTGCKWIAEPTPGTTTLAEYFTSGEACVYNVNADYVPLCWEYSGNQGGHSYFSEWFFGDIVSDDALKGGEGPEDGPAVLNLDNFGWDAANGLVLDYYRTNYIGIGRCNLSLANIPNVECDSIMSESVKNRLLGEVYFLRAYYYFRLVRMFGAVPLVTAVQYSDWERARTPVDSIYAQIESDLMRANDLLWKKSATTGENVGRATQGAAQAMLIKMNLYRHNYAEAERWGQIFLQEQAGEYALNANYADKHENDMESVFEIQYTEESTSDYTADGMGYGASRGTFTTILTRARSGSIPQGPYTGWGWNKPTQNLYDEFENDDPRRDATIFLPDPALRDEADNYLGCEYLNRKTGLYNAAGDGVTYELPHYTRGDLNNKQIRYADVLLMYAEACAENGNDAAAQNALEEVRARARANAADPATALPQWPNYSYVVSGVTVDASSSLINAIRHERRVELAMEGHRWFDLVRWGNAMEVMAAYQNSESLAVHAYMQPMREFQYLFPIPIEELKLNPMLTQNPGY